MERAITAARAGTITEAITAVGTMSGTSLDGVDAAVLVTDGVSLQGFGPRHYRPYGVREREVIRRALGRWPGEPGVEEAARVVEDAHAEALSGLPGEIVGFHGQTLAHGPGARGTHQTGDGARLARALGRPVVWDFRSADVAAGGQGAPLAPFFHFACARWMDARAPLAILNLGGVGNVTWIDPNAEGPEEEGALLAFDTGPANAPLNDFLLVRRGRALDEGGAIAARGRADEGVVADLLSDPFFRQRPPKSLDRDAFARLAAGVADLCDEDGAATLTAAIAACVAEGARHFPAPVTRWLVTGGGRHNATLMGMLAHVLDAPVLAVEAVGLDGDMLEAQAFAYLAVRSLRGFSLSAPMTTGVPSAQRGGRVSQPNPAP